MQKKDKQGALKRSGQKHSTEYDNPETVAAVVVSVEEDVASVGTLSASEELKHNYIICTNKLHYLLTKNNHSIKYSLNDNSGNNQ